MDRVERSGILKYTNQIIQAFLQIKSFKYITVKIFVNLLSESFQHLHTSRKNVSKKRYKKLFSLTLSSPNYFIIDRKFVFLDKFYTYIYIF